MAMTTKVPPLASPPPPGDIWVYLCVMDCDQAVVGGLRSAWS